MLFNSTESLKLTLPWPPSVNNYKTVGRIIKTKTGKLYQQRRNSMETKTFYWLVYQEVKRTMTLEQAKFAQDETIYLNVYVGLYPPHARRYDVDNRLKVLLDSLVRARVIYDDSQITRLLVEKHSIFENGKAEVEISVGEKYAPQRT